MNRIDRAEKYLIEKFKSLWDVIKTPHVATPKDEESKKRLKQRHEECSKNLRNSILTFSGFAAVSWSALSIPDIELIASQSTVKIPFAQTIVTLDNFLAIAPYITLLLISHSTMYRLRLNAIDPHVDHNDRFSTLFNLPGGMAKIATLFLHVVLPLAFILFLYTKSISYGGSVWGVFTFSITSLLLIWPYFIWHTFKLKTAHYQPALKTLIITIHTFTILFVVFIYTNKGFPPNFSYINFTDKKTIFDKVMNIKNADFTGSTFTALEFSTPRLSKPDFTDAALDDAKLSNISIFRGEFFSAQLKGANLSNSTFTAANFTSADMTGTNLSEADFSSVFEIMNFHFGTSTFAHTNLINSKSIGANFSGVDFTGANLSGSDLVGAILRGADCDETNFKDANLDSVDLTDADLSTAINFVQGQLTTIKYDDGSPPKLPAGLKLPQ